MSQTAQARREHGCGRASQRPGKAGTMERLERITFDPTVMGGRPCIRGMRVTVGVLVGLVASGHSREEVLAMYPYLEEPDIREALAYAAWRAEEIEVPTGGA